MDLVRDIAISLGGYIDTGGWIMLPLGVCSLLMWTMIIERLLAYRAMVHGDIGIGRAVETARGDAPLPPTGGLRWIVVRDYLAERDAGATVDPAETVRQSVGRIRPGLRRFLAGITVLAAAAPLLGLLGTVVGMIRTFDVISVFGTGNAKAMAGGISVALITTQSGLLTAIPGLFMGAALSRRARSLERGLVEFGTILERRLAETGGAR